MKASKSMLAYIVGDTNQNYIQLFILIRTTPCLALFTPKIAVLLLLLFEGNE